LDASKGNGLSEITMAVESPGSPTALKHRRKSTDPSGRVSPFMPSKAIHVNLMIPWLTSLSPKIEEEISRLLDSDLSNISTVGSQAIENCKVSIRSKLSTIISTHMFSPLATSTGTMVSPRLSGQFCDHAVLMRKTNTIVENNFTAAEVNLCVILGFYLGFGFVRKNMTNYSY